MAYTVTAEDNEFLAKCEEELKDRFTEIDEEFMKVFNLEASVPPILESWWVPNNRRSDRRQNRSYHPYEKHGGSGGGGRSRDSYDRRYRRDGGDRRSYSDRRDGGDRRSYSDRRDGGDRRSYSDHNRGYHDISYSGHQQRY